MTLSKLYSNRPHEFQAVVFAAGVNAVIAEIRLPENRSKDTHNLGKSLIGRMLDYGFLSGRDVSFFLFKHEEIFSRFTFYLEVALRDGSYVTVRRGVENSSKIAFKRHSEKNQDFSGLPDSAWDHVDVPLERARELLDGLLDWRALKPWHYRKALGYLLRSQDDYQDVFQLRRFMSKHGDWKPFIAHILGFNSQTISLQYGKEAELEEKKETENKINNELGGTVEDISKIEGILLLKQREAEKAQRLLDAFDFRSQDKVHTKELVDVVDERIAQLNSTRYSLSQSRKKIIASLTEDQILFDPEQAQSLFKEAGIFFEGQIKKDFDQLIEFNRAITEERRKYLEIERDDIDREVKQINAELSKLGKQRSNALAFLSETDAFDKYKLISQELVTLKADIATHERQREFLHRLQQLRTDIRSLTAEVRELQERVEADVEAQNSDRSSLFSSIRVYFNDFIEEVIGRKALLSVSPNAKGHLEFKAEILDEEGHASSADMGHTYRKLLCIAFDLAVAMAHAGDDYPRFVYHDGVFESLDDRKKENLLSVIRECADHGVQSVTTMIDTDLPPRSPDNPVFDESEVVLLLHDQGPEGRLFTMKSW